MHGYYALRTLTNDQNLKKGDTLVLFGELFQRGYANGLLEAAERRGMNVVYATVGRRTKDGELRNLNEEEVQNSRKPLINVALEAGFDMEISAITSKSPAEMLHGVGLKEWEQTKLNWESIEDSKQKGQKRFANSVAQFFTELEKIIPQSGNVVVAHLMAGGVPRTKIVMPLMNRVFKGFGERHVSSKIFWDSEIGKLCQMSFMEVTANTFNILMSASTAFREKLKKNSREVFYTAYGYHGTEVIYGSKLQWQSYTPYLQGYAKKRLEDIAKEWSAKSVKATTYNCPEILTNSSSIFQGVEIPLYPLLHQLKKDSQINPKKFEQVWSDCSKMMKPEFSLEKLLSVCDEGLCSKEFTTHLDFNSWPQHNSQAQMDKMLSTSDQLMGMHLSEKNLITSYLSEVVFAACGEVMISDCGNPQSPVSWINHDIVSDIFLSRIP